MELLFLEPCNIYSYFLLFAFQFVSHNKAIREGKEAHGKTVKQNTQSKQKRRWTDKDEEEAEAGEEKKTHKNF